MKSGAILLRCATLGLVACNRPARPLQDQQQPAPTASANAAQGNQAGAPDNRTRFNEPAGLIDPKSLEAAGEVVQTYGALIEQGRWSKANALWDNPGEAAKFKISLAPIADAHLEVGNLGEPEGAAGSIYVTMPVIFYGDLQNGQPFRRSADVTLRRVNDVPGSTEAQRRWHIERIDWAS